MGENLDHSTNSPLPVVGTVNDEENATIKPQGPHPSRQEKSDFDSERRPTHHLHRWIWFITGPTACGKTTIAKSLASALKFSFLEGDDYHPKASVEKMSRGEPLNDEDRAGWLQALKEHEIAQPQKKQTNGDDPEGKSRHLVTTCSALKKHYRDLLRQGGEEAKDLRVRFVFLDASEETLTKRAAERKGHFAGANLVHSQFEALERPDENEKDVVVVNVEGSLEDSERQAEMKLKEEMGKDDGSFLEVL
ncbi:putative gluconokinase [Podospora australis]|uniref:Gluconokinase n=1 Tax=Podospora australis TaxID=1536484 RepID=A0AAN6WWD9_9PEZI|nr:putative gluconokinase [Podospora australis]